jgi:hypothetical protein
MTTEQYIWQEGNWMMRSGTVGSPRAQQHLTFIFGDRHELEAEGAYQQYSAAFGAGHVITCSSAGNIHADGIEDLGIVATTVQLNDPDLRAVSIEMEPNEAPFALGQRLAERFMDVRHELRLVYLLSSIDLVNGTDLVAGVVSKLGINVPLAGGLAGDGSRFERTLVSLDGPPAPNRVVAVAFMGKDLLVGNSAQKGWDSFGPSRKVTRSKGNVLYELDDRPALALYKTYLAELAAELPASALLFPLRIIDPGSGDHLIRTVLGVNEADQSMTFAGNIPEGVACQLMSANFDKLVDSAVEAAECSSEHLGSIEPQLALMVSCVGRKIALGSRAVEEVEEATLKLGASSIAGFYSYGEIGPDRTGSLCQLHNQSFTITTLAER